MKIIFLTLFLIYSNIAIAENYKLTTKEGKTFPITVSVDENRSLPTVVYVTGLGGKSNSLAKLSKEFLEKGLNLITFDRNEPDCKGFKCFGTVGSRSKSNQLIYAEDNQETAIENIVENEVKSVLEFIKSSSWYESDNGIYIIGGSFGAWITLSLLSDEEIKNDIKGVVFLSPSTAPHKSSGKYANEIITYNSLIKNIVEIKGLAIGSPNDELFPGATTKDAVDFLAETIPQMKIKKIITNSKLHAKELLKKDSEIKNDILNWIVENN